MMGVTWLDPARYRRTPWKNGGGVTIDIADAYAPGAAPGGWEGMLWRFGRTRIVAPGPFSDLSGYDRILTVVEGEGLTLEIEGGATLDVRTPFRPVRFRGEDRIVSRLEAGPVAVLNLIADRKRTIDVAILGGADARPLGGISIVYAIGDSVVALGEEVFSLAADAALRIEGLRQPISVRSGRVALALIGA